MTLPKLTKPSAVALFLDFDGTLVEITDRPEGVLVGDATRATLFRLQTLLSGAVAIITGRDIETIDLMLAPFRCPVAGVHGLTRRDAEGRAYARAIEPLFLDAAADLLASLAVREPGLIVERKSHAIALHYRARPELEAVCAQAMEDVARLTDGVRLLRGKMVIEARPGGGNKGTAVADFLSEPPFAGRIPIFAGDDVTDEDAFVLVNARGGDTVKIGPGETHARHRLPDTAAFLAWLHRIADQLEKGGRIG